MIQSDWSLSEDRSCRTSFSLLLASTFAALFALSSAGCTPRVAIETPTEPITINMNVKIEHEITIRVDKELDELMLDDDLFGEVE
jgi:hypothetical protein